MNSSTAATRPSLDASFAWSLLQNPLLSEKSDNAKWISNENIAELKGLFIFLSDSNSNSEATTREYISLSAAETGIRMLGFGTDKFRSFTSVVDDKVTFELFLSKVQEILIQKKATENDLRFFFSFFSTVRSSQRYLSRKQLRHLLLGIESPFKLSAADYVAFEKSLLIDNDGVDSFPIEFLVKRILFDPSALVS